jgi:hypothetical protein
MRRQELPKEKFKKKETEVDPVSCEFKGMAREL